MTRTARPLAAVIVVATAVLSPALLAQDKADEGAAAAEDGKDAKDAKDKAKEEAKQKAKERLKEKIKEKQEAEAAGGAATPAATTTTPPTTPPRVAQATPPATTPAASTSGAGAGGGIQKEPTPCKPQTGKTWFNFEKANINDVLDQISRMKCMNFILSESVKGKGELTIISRSQVSVNQAYAAFLSALEANGMALVPAGAYWKVVERKESVKTTIPLYEMKDGALRRVDIDDQRSGDLPNSDAQVTLLYDVKHAPKETVQNLIRNLMTKNADLQSPSGNLFILTDSGSNILRILEVLDKIDVEGTSAKLNVVTLQYADVGGVVQKLNEIFGVGQDKNGGAAVKVKKKAKKPADKEAPDTSSAPDDGGDEGDLSDVAIEKIIADERVNQLIVISSPKAFEKVLEVLKILDVPVDGTGTDVRIWVVPLANSDAQKAASTLSNLASGSVAKKPAADAKGGAKAKEAEKSAALFEGEVKVTADETTNSLVVVASGRDFRALRKVIEQLDARRPQVFVEAAIMEVALNQNRSVGLNAYASTPVPFVGGTGIGIAANEGGRQLFQDSAKVVAGQQILQNLQETGRLDSTSIGSVIDASTSISSLLGFLSFVGPSVEVLPGLSLPSVGAVLNLLQTDANVDILSTPHIMTTDNEKAEISVGQRVPVVKGVSAIGGAGGFGVGLQSNVSFEDVKLKFAITPHVNSDGEVRLELEQEVSDLAGDVPIGNGQTAPIIANRTVKNTVVARDQQTIAIAGLISDRKNDSTSKVPFFGDIPIVGWLFKTWKDGKQKTNLLIVLTPYVVRDQEDFRKIYERKMAERKAFVDAYFSDARVYNPYVDYDKKTGPLGALSAAIQYEMEAVENGGAGHGEQLIGPDASFRPRKVGDDGKPANGGPPPPPDDDGGDDNTPDAPPPPAPEAVPPPPPAAPIVE